MPQGMPTTKLSVWKALCTNSREFCTLAGLATCQCYLGGDQLSLLIDPQTPKPNLMIGYEDRDRPKTQKKNKMFERVILSVRVHFIDSLNIFHQLFRYKTTG